MCGSVLTLDKLNLRGSFFVSGDSITHTTRSSNKHNLGNDMSDVGTQTEEPANGQPANHAESLSTDMTDTEKQDTVVAPSAPSATDWNGPDDPDNPHNWPLWLRIYHATTPGFFGFAV